MQDEKACILHPASLALYLAFEMRSFSSIAPIILAAGDSTRMGYPKALLPIGNDIFITHILRLVQKVGLASPTIILGRAAEIIQPAIQNWPAAIRINPDPDRGQLSSIQLGLSSLNANAQAGMIWPVDHPAVSEDLVASLAELFIQSKSLIAFPKCGDKRGHPAIFHRALFQEFMDAPLEEGPKSILVRHQQDTVELRTDESAAVEDIDTQSDYESLIGESVESALTRKNNNAMD
jgi:molybdenum cofactor cytidylyltransferase